VMTDSSVVRAFPAHPSALFHIRRFVRERADDAGVSDDFAADLVIAVSEACANSVVHTSSPDVRVTWRDTETYVEVLVLDRGVFENRVPMPELGMGGGHGMPLMMALVDEVTVREGTPARPGTLVRLIKRKKSS
jgi:anti-sigma regulatory factor (Ser/Thr protein kinase)